MRDLPTIRGIWNTGLFLGLDKSHGRVTVEADWSLTTTGPSYGAGDRGPYRWWYDATEARPSASETEVPNIKTINIDSSLDQDAASCTITLYNQFHPTTGTAPILPTTLGEPGYYSYTYGTSPEAQALFGQSPNAWENVLVPNALLRCVDVETEILTKRGWLQYNEVQVGDETLGINTETGESEWQIIEEVFRAPYQGELMRLTSKSHDSLTTGNHRWLIQDISGKFSWKTSETLNWRSRIPLSAPYKAPVEKTLSDDFVELVAWYYTEGTADHRLRSMSWGGSISQSKTVNPKSWERINSLFQRMYGDPGSLPRGVYISQDMVDEGLVLIGQGVSTAQVAERVGVCNETARRWRKGERLNPKSYKWDLRLADRADNFVFSAEVANSIREYICGPDKVPSMEFLLALTNDQLELFIEVCILGDGCATGPQVDFIQCHEGRTRAFEIACVLAGKAFHSTGGKKTCLKRNSVTTPISSMKQRGLSEEDYWEAYDGIVWCPRVKHGNWFARRNGTGYFTGNTYQGYGGWTQTGETMTPDSITDAVTNGNLALTGTWLIDTVSLGSDGLITLACRDMVKLLLDQFVMTPLVPDRFYPLEYCRFYEETIAGDPGTEGTPGDPGNPGTPASTEPLPASFAGSSVDVWYPSGYPTGDGSTYWGTSPSSIVDGNSSTFSISVGNEEIDRIWNKTWWDVSLGGQAINEVFLDIEYGFGTTWISVYENGAWQTGVNGGIIPFDDANDDGRSDSLLASQGTAAPIAADKPFVVRTGVQNGQAQWIPLDRVYDADVIRVTTVSTHNAGLACPPYCYRSALRQMSGRLTLTNPEDNPGYVAPTPGTPGIPATPDTVNIVDGNIVDWTDVVHDLLSWSGFLEYAGATPSGGAPVHALIQTSGTYPDECLTEELFDKKSVLDAIRTVKEVLGYIMFATHDGKIRFHYPNFWNTGNIDDDAQPAEVLSLYDEHTVVSYTSTFTDEYTRSEIIVGDQRPRQGEEAVTYARVPGDFTRPGDPSLLRGMVRPAMWIDEHLGDAAVQRTMAAIIATHLYLQAKRATVSSAANPELQLDDQVFILERVASEGYLHSVRGINTTMDLDTGEYTMSLTTNWLGDNETVAELTASVLAAVQTITAPSGTGDQSGVPQSLILHLGESAGNTAIDPTLTPDPNPLPPEVFVPDGGGFQTGG